MLMKHLGIAYSDIRQMPVRYRNWYISKYIENANEEIEHRKNLLESRNNKSTRSF